MKEEFEDENKLNHEENQEENFNEAVETEGNTDTKNIENVDKAEPEEVVKKNKSKKNKKVILGVFLGIIAALIILFLATPYKLLFNTKKMTFLTYFTKDLSSIVELADNIATSDIIEFFNNNEVKSIDLQIGIDEKNLSGNLVFNKDFSALKLNEVNEKYYMIENNKIGELIEKFNTTGYEITSDIKAKDLAKLTNSEKRKIRNFILNSCYDILDIVETDRIGINENNILSTDVGEVEAKSIELKLTETQFLEVQKIALQRALDDGLIDIIIKKIGGLVVDGNELKDSYKSYIEYLENYIDYMRSYNKINNVSESNFIIYRIYLDEDEIISREVTEKYFYEGSNYEDIIFSLITLDNYYEVKVFEQIDETAAYYTILSDTITEEENIKNHKLSYRLDGFVAEYSEEKETSEYNPVSSEVVYNIVVEELDDDTTKITLNDEENGYNVSLDYNKDKINLVLMANLDTKLSLNVNCKKDNTITKKSLIENNAIELNKKSSEELANEFSNIGVKISEIFQDVE